MKIAVAAMGKEVAEHFGHCENFIFFEAQNGAITAEDSIPNPGHRPGFLPNFLADHGAEVIMDFLLVVWIVFGAIWGFFFLLLFHYIVFTVIGIFKKKTFPKTEEKRRYGILIGARGASLKRVGTQARIDMEDFFQKKVFLQLYVKVDPHWRDDKRKLAAFGY